MTPILTAVVRSVALFLVIAVMATSIAEAAPNPLTPMDSVTLHQKLTTRGVGKGVKVTELDGTVVKGTLVSIEDDSFELTPAKTTTATRIQNSQVVKVANNGMSTGGKVATGVIIGVVAGIAIIVIAIAIAVKSDGY